MRRPAATYVPDEPCPRGNRLRYLNDRDNRCVQCAKDASKGKKAVWREKKRRELDLITRVLHRPWGKQNGTN